MHLVSLWVMRKDIEGFCKYLELERRLSENTVKAYRNDLKQLEDYLRSTYELEEFSDLSASMLRSWLVSMVDNDLANSSVNRKIASARRFGRYLKRQGSITLNPFEQLHAIRKEKRIPTFAQVEDLEVIMNRPLPNNFVHACEQFIVLTLYQYGLRRSELINLKYSDVSSNTIRVMGKGGKERILPTAPMWSARLPAYLKLRTEYLDGQQSVYLFVRKNGEALYPKYVYNAVQKYLQRIPQLPKKSPHVLRHSFATHLSNNGADINAIKALLGHQNLAATQIYTHSSIAHLMKAYRQAHPRGESDKK